MGKVAVLVVALFFFVVLVVGFKPPNVVWINPDGIGNSMPLGNGIIAGNFWIQKEKSQLSFYVASQEAWDENANILKLARVDFTFTPNPFTQPTTSAILTHDLSTSSINVTIERIMNIRIWIDANNPFIVTEIGAWDSTHPFQVAVSLTNLRPNPTPFISGWYCSHRYTWPDTVVENVYPPLPAQSLLWYHRNNPPPGASFFESSLKTQDLSSLIGKWSDPTLNNTFGGVIFVDPSVAHQSPMDRVNPTLLQSRGSILYTRVIVAVHTNKTESINGWYNQLSELVSSWNAGRWAAHLEAWNKNWNTSYIQMLNPLNAYISDKYAYHRYLQLVQSKARFPLKFNGMIFVAEEGVSPDHRNWGGANWWQNARLSYWANFGAGDLNLVYDSLFLYYLSMLDLGRVKTEIYWGENTNKSNLVDVYWPETQTIYGLEYNNGGYGCPGSRGDLHPGVPLSAWNRYNINGGLDLSMMILDHYDFVQDLAALQKVFPIVRGVLSHFKHHWTKINSTTGKVIFFPTQALETWQCQTYPPVVTDCVTNPLPDIAGLRAVIPRVIKLPDSVVSAQEKQEWSKYYSILPETPKGPGGTYLIPGEIIPSKPINVENTELYAVHPYRLYTRPKKNELIAVTTFNRRRFPCNVGWCQDILDAALLGLTEAAQTMVEQRAVTPPAQGYRWPGFMPSFQDYKPSSDHLSNMNSALQWMILQPVGDDAHSIELFPTWPCDWDVEFKLHGPLNTWVSGVLKNGVLSQLQVYPPSRRSAVHISACKQTTKSL